MNSAENGERLAILKMIEGGQISADQASELLDALESPEGLADTTMPDATVEEEAWMLTALLQVTQAVSGPPAGQESMTDMLDRVVRIVPLLAGVDRCAVYLWDEAEQGCAAKAWYPTHGQPPPPAETLLVEQARLGSGPAVSSGAQMTAVLLPMTAGGKFLGVMQVAYLHVSHSFSPKETAILANVALQAAVGIENLLLREEAVERAKLEQELQLARGVQQSLMPASPPLLPGWQIASHWQAARSVAGDFYDFLPLGGRLGLVVADVSGKGMPAALFMALARTIVRASVGGSSKPARAIEQANRLIYHDAHEGMFVTLILGIIDPRQHSVTYTNAGHNPPLLVSQGSADYLEGRGRALGLLSTLSLTEHPVTMQPGDVLVFYTDGLTEAINSKEEQFGAERLARAVLGHAHLAPAAIIDRVMQALAAFVGAQPAFDDATILVAKCVA